MSTLETTFIQHPSSEQPNIRLNSDGTVNIAKTLIGPGQYLTLDQDGKIPFETDKIIISTTDPDPGRGDQNWLWLKV